MTAFMYPSPIRNLIDGFKKLPAVGEHTAERFVFYLLKAGKKDVGEIMLALKNLIDNIKSCEVCWNFTDTNPCKICNNSKRDQSTICVVVDPQDLEAIEKTNEFNGRYHLLRGLVDAGDKETLDKIKGKELLDRVKGETSKIREVVLALNPDVAGETTMLYLEKKLTETKPHLKVSRLARGIPMGGDLRYADEITLGSAFKNRTIK